MQTSKTYIRFVCFRSASQKRPQIGIFQAIDEARDCAFAPPWALRELGELYEWFGENLAVPRQFSSGGWKGDGQPGLSWFKPNASVHIERMHRLKLALEACGVGVEILTTRDPGQVFWQDKHQLVADPEGRKFRG